MTTLPVPHLRFYTRTGCHLCEAAEYLLARLAGELGVTAEVTVIDLAEEPAFEADYGFRVPVIETDAGSCLEAPIRENDLRALLLSLPAANEAGR